MKKGSSRPMEMALQLQNVNHSFGATRVLGNINLEIERGSITSIVGPSGGGKSTLLKAILGRYRPTSGTIFANGKEVISLSRDIGSVDQDYPLYEYLTAQENVAQGLLFDQTNFWRRANISKWRNLRRKHMEEAAHMLEKVELAGAENKYPSELSGGMKQRVAIAQALIMKPKVLLLDEPFGALDAATREELQMLLLDLYRENLAAKAAGTTPPYTIMIITHELDEAIYVAERVIGLSQYHSGNNFDGKYINRNGATIVYDKPAPVFTIKEDRDFTMFAAQKEELMRAVFDETAFSRRENHITFWQEYQHCTIAQGI